MEFVRFVKCVRFVKFVKFVKGIDSLRFDSWSTVKIKSGAATLWVAAPDYDG